MQEKILLKDLLFNRVKIEKIAREIQRVYPEFLKTEFIQATLQGFPDLELKARIDWISVTLKKYLPLEYSNAIEILIKALPAPNNPDLSDNDFGDFIYAPYAKYMVDNGCTHEHLVLSLKALYEITQRFSAEYAIRYFINAFPEKTLATLSIWAKDAHYHVRRLCSEGTRPKLPWAHKINFSNTASLSILNLLFSDTTRFVTRSVANHLNDISKSDPELVIHTLQSWQTSKQQKTAEMAYITRHALRTLIKQGNAQALNLLGFSNNAPVSLQAFHIPKEVHMNTALEFSCTLMAPENTPLIVDYTLYFQNKKGELANKKVFKLKKLSLEKDISITLKKSHLLRGNMTTRALYPGLHALEIHVNGNSVLKESFALIQ